MKEYYIYIESYVFLFYKKGKVLIYDSILGKSYLTEYDTALLSILERLMNLENMYVIPINETDLDNKYVHTFVSLLKENFCGDLFPKSELKTKPISFPPILDFQYLKKKRDESKLDNNILSNLKEISIYLNNKCNNKLCSQKCAFFNTQILFCSKQNNNISTIQWKKLKNFLTENYLENIKFNILGGNIYQHPDITNIIDFFKNQNAIYYVHYSIFNKDLNFYNKLNCKILIDYPFNVDLIEHVFVLTKKNTNIEYEFIIKDYQTFSTASYFQKKYSTKKVSIIPIYDNNLSFFQTNVFIQSNDLKKTQLSKKDIFRNQTLNSHYFGHLIVDCNGDIYAGRKDIIIGSIYSCTLKDILTHALNDKQSPWLQIRDQKPCSECVYQWLCPSPNNYEIALKQSCLCHITNL